jgi:hypothetical protein
LTPMAKTGRRAVLRDRRQHWGLADVGEDALTGRKQNVRFPMDCCR